MGRSVYFDPFGMRLAGQQAGIRDEAFLQDQTRRARQSDYEYNVTQPIQLHNMQRDSAFADHADPFYRRNLGYQEDIMKGGIYDNESARRDKYAIATGDQNLSRQLDAQRYPADSTQTVTQRQPSPAIDAFNSYHGILEQLGIDPLSPEGQQYARSAEQMAGLPQGFLSDENAMAQVFGQAELSPEETVRQQSRYNPLTGQMEAIPTNSMGYYDRAMQPQYFQNAQLRMQGSQVQSKLGYNEAMIEQARINAGGAAGAGGASGVDHYGGD